MRIKIYAVVVIFIGVFSSPIHSQQDPKALVLPDGNPPASVPKLDISANFYEAIEDADIVLLASIENVSTDITDDVFAEAYSLLALKGEVATPNGPKALADGFILRASAAWAHRKIEKDTKYLFFIKNHRESYNPIRRMHRVKNGDVYHHADSTKTIYSISRTGDMETMPAYNTCDVSEYHALYNAEEDLNNVMQFTCANGSDWIRGNDQPRSDIETKLSGRRLIQIASGILKVRNLSSPDLSSGYKAIVNIPLQSWAKVDEWTDYSDAIFKRYMESFDSATWKKVYTVKPENDRRTKQYVIRQLARGKLPRNMTRHAQTVVSLVERERQEKIRLYKSKAIQSEKLIK